MAPIQQLSCAKPQWLNSSCQFCFKMWFIHYVQNISECFTLLNSGQVTSSVSSWLTMALVPSELFRGTLSASWQSGTSLGSSGVEFWTLFTVDLDSISSALPLTHGVSITWGNQYVTNPSNTQHFVWEIQISANDFEPITYLFVLIYISIFPVFYKAPTWNSD